MRKNWHQRRTRVAPLVDDLFQHPGVGMLGNKAGSQQLDSFAGNFFDNRRIVQEPPASKGHEVAEFSCIDAQFVLILTTKDAHQKTVFWIVSQDVFERAKIGSA